MSLAEQIQRVDGSQNDILKKVLGAFGVTVGENKIDRLAALAKLAPLLKENSILSSDTRALYNLDTDAVPDDVLALLSKAALYKTVTQTAQIGTIPIGGVIYLNENGSPVPYIVVNRGIPENSGLYDSSCNGTWVLRKDVLKNAVWDAGNSNVVQGADIFSTMAGLLTLYDSNVQSAIKTVKIPYAVGGGSTTIKSGANGLQCKIFPLSTCEMGFDPVSYVPRDGATLSYFEGLGNFDQKRIAYLNSVAVEWHLRSSFTTDTKSVLRITTGGTYIGGDANEPSGIRPAFILPDAFTVNTSLPETGLYDLFNTLLLKLPGVQIATGSYIGTGKYGADNPSSLTFEFEPKILIVQKDSTNYAAYSKIVAQNGMKTANNGNSAGNNDYYVTFINWTHEVSWYSYSKNGQLNSLGTTYYYLALG